MIADERKPDFSGEYVLNPQTSALSPAIAAAIQSGVMRIDHRDLKFGCQMSTVFDSRPIEHAFELMTDGREISSTDQGRPTVCSMYWKENTLVFTARTTAPDFEFAMSWRYALLDDQRQLRAVEQIRGGGRDQDNIWVYERR